MNAFRRSAYVALALAGTAGTAAAQAKCDINTGKPFQLQSARIYFNKAASPSGKPDEKPKHLASGIKVLTEQGHKIDNQIGRHWLLTKLLYQWSREDKQAMITTRGKLGYTENPGGPVDILVAVDSSLDFVEQANPACRDSAMVYRRALYNGTYSKGVEFLNAEQLDSAEYYLKRSLIINDRGPLSYNALSIVAQKRNDEAAMTEYYGKVIEASGADTAHAGMRKTAMVNLGVLKVNQAEAAQGERKTQLLREAETMFRRFLEAAPGDANAQQGLARVLNALGDTAAIARIYQDMLAKPEGFSDIQLLEAGSGALRAKQQKIGVALIEAGLKKNPYHRDGLYNLAAALFDADDADALAPVVKRLVDVDPNNPDNWRLYAGQFQIRQQAAQKTKKPAPKWVTDSLLLYIQKYQGMTTQVQISDFRHAGAKHELTGTLMNSGAKAVEANLEVEFLDATGQVVARKSVPVKADPNSSSEFKVDVVQSGIVAFRYKPIA